MLRVGPSDLKKKKKGSYFCFCKGFTLNTSHPFYGFDNTVLFCSMKFCLKVTILVSNSLNQILESKTTYKDHILENYFSCYLFKGIKPVLERVKNQCRIYRLFSVPT